MLTGIKLIAQPIKKMRLLDEKFDTPDRVGLRLQNGLREIVEPPSDIIFPVGPPKGSPKGPKGSAKGPPKQRGQSYNLMFIKFSIYRAGSFSVLRIAEARQYATRNTI